MMGDETDGHAAWQRMIAEREGRDPSLATLPLAGDLLEAAIKRFGGDRLARYVERKTGKPCNCIARKEALNRLDASLRKYLGL